MLFARSGRFGQASTTRSLWESDIGPDTINSGDNEILTQAEQLLRGAIRSFDLPLRQPELELLGIVRAPFDSSVVASGPR